MESVAFFGLAPFTFTAHLIAPDLEAERGHDEAGGDQERRERVFGGGRAVDLADQQSAFAAIAAAAMSASRAASARATRDRSGSASGR